MKLEESLAKLELLSNTDDLTQIYNRRKFEHKFNEEISRSKRTGLPFSLIMFDIDFFKEVNDEFGHVVGDQVLVKLTEDIATQVRLEDTFARFGGEEFVIILSNSNIEQVIEKAETLRQYVKEIVFNNDIIITLSFGVTQFKQGESSKEMFQRVDEALYEAKEAGRDSVVSR